MAETLGGKYQVVKHLSDGDMAEVLVARSHGLEGFVRHVVIKRIKAEQAQKPDAVARFLREARLSATMHHANIVQVHDIGEENGEYFFAMEYVHGEDLRQMLRQVYLRGEKFPLDHAVKIVIGVCCGLHHAHQHHGPDGAPLGLVHRDVSPANILVGYDGSVKVADFGVAKATLQSGGTRTGAFKGSVAYMSPEQCLGEPLDRRSDIFSLGVVLHEVVTTKRLFKGENAFVVMEKIVSGEIPHPATLRPDLPPALGEVIMRAVSRHPEERYETAEDMQLALEEIAVELRSTTQTLVAYMNRLFGARPEPWLVEGDLPQHDHSINFDVDTHMKTNIAVGTKPRARPTPPSVPLDFMDADAKTTLDPDAALKALATARASGTIATESGELDAVLHGLGAPTETPAEAAPAEAPAEAAPEAAEAPDALADAPAEASEVATKVRTSAPVLPVYRGGWSTRRYVLLVGVLLAAIAAGVWWFVMRDRETPAAQPSAPPAEPIVAPTPSPTTEDVVKPKPEKKRSKKKSSYDPKALFPPK